MSAPDPRPGTPWPRPAPLPVWVALVFAGALVAAWFTKARCLLTDVNWQNGEQYFGYCYTDIYPLWWAERLNEGAVPYFGHPVEYPVLTGAWMWLANQFALLFPAGLQGRAYLQITMLLGAAALTGAFWLLHRMGVPPRRLLWFALAPTFVVYAFMNWDALPVLLSVAAISGHRRDRDVAAGMLAGLGAAAKLYPVFLVPLFALARLRQRRFREAAFTCLAGAGAWLAVNLPVYLGAPDGWGRFLELSRERPADHDSLYRIVEVYLLGDGRVDVGLLNLVTAVLFLVSGALVVWAGSRRRDPADIWQLFLPLLVVFLLTSKVYSPQFSLWLLPLFALGFPRLRPFLLFCAADLAVFATRFPWLGGRDGFEPVIGFPLFAGAIALRAAVLIWVVVVAVRERPAYLDRPQAQPLPAPAGSSVGSG